ncbi:MAG: hypothetical protein PHV13_03690 [Candidatus ainarchaeum sp.]|nr:hypothetical protein [Candidatus ainarchaeum sp.]
MSEYTVSRDSFKPGEVGIATVTLTNPAGSDLVSGLTMTIDNPPEITISSAPALADIASGGSAVVSMPFKIKPDARPGIYLLNVLFTGYTTQLGTGQLPTTNTVSIPVVVVNAPILSFSTATPVIGGIDSISLLITNNGGAARNLRISIPSTSTVALYSTSEIYVGDALTSVPTNMTLDARSASDGAVDIPIILKYDDELGISHTDNSTLHLTVKNEVLDLRFNQLQPLVTRQDGTLSLEVTNNGQALSDVRLSFTNTSMRLSDRNEILIGDLGPGEKKSISASVYDDLTPGLSLVGAKISWIERDIRKEQQLDIPLTIGSDADVSVYLDAKPSPLTAGVEHTISVLVSNVGSYGIDNVDVGISSPAFESLDITPRQYIGSLAKDDFSTVQFKVQVDAGPGDYPISINVRYRDASGGWVAKTIDQTASVKGAASDASGTIYLLLGLAAVAAAAVWYFKLRKKG